jgi:predicted short-subunit dehydrogenase-like oxidoreductase (DUF2520 family)
VLAGASARGLPVGAFHPLQSFPAPRPPEAFEGVLFAIDASDAELLAELESLASRLGGRPRRVLGSDRARYHAAGTLIGPLLIALAAQTAEVFGELGFSREEAIEAMVPFMRGTVDNLEALGLPDALIGPVRRGDPRTVARHLSALSGDALESYRALTRTAIRLAEEAGLGADAARELRELI